MALYIPHSIFHLARILYVRPETFGPYYVHLSTPTHPRAKALPISAAQIMKLLTIQFFHPPLTSSLLAPYISLSTSLSSTPRPHSYRNVTDLVLHPCKITGKITVCTYISNPTPLDSKRQDRMIACLLSSPHLKSGFLSSSARSCSCKTRCLMSQHRKSLRVGCCTG